MEPDSEEVIIDTGKSIGNAQTVSETVSEGFKGEDQQSQPNLERYNPKQYGSKMRDFQPSWHKKFLGYIMYQN